MKLKEIFQYQRSKIPDSEGALDRSKMNATRFFVDRGDILGPSCAWLLVLPGKFFSHCNAISR